MKRYKLFLGCIFVLLLALLLVWQVVLAQTGGYDLSWNSLSVGGAISGIADPAYSLDTAIGQPLAGIIAGTGGLGRYTLCAGYLCGVQASTKVYLPLVRK